MAFGTPGCWGPGGSSLSLTGFHLLPVPLPVWCQPRLLEGEARAETGVGSCKEGLVWGPQLPRGGQQRALPSETRLGPLTQNAYLGERKQESEPWRQLLAWGGEGGLLTPLLQGMNYQFC